MGREEVLSRTVPLRSFFTKAMWFFEWHKFIAFHINKLRCGDKRTRDSFRHIQMWYTQALGLPLEKVREYIHLVKLRELEGFAVEPITRPFEVEQHNDSDQEDGGAMEIDTDLVCNTDNDVFWGPSEAMSLEEDTLKDLGFNTRGEYEDFLTAMSDPTIPSTTQWTEYPQNSLVTNPYDENGFYTPDLESMFLSLESNGCSWAEETEEAQQAETPSISHLDHEQSSDVPEPSPSANHELEEQPLSAALRNILEEMGVDVNISRTNRIVILTPEEVGNLDALWDQRVAKNEILEASANSFSWYYEESADEMALLDAWDEQNDQYYWQTEGLFLCRLTELVHKNSFELSRRLNWTQVKQGAKYLKRKTLPQSRLRNEILMEEDVEMEL
ncbi:hypothetical protein F4803DRAFT_555675 [Xylaria telfairii]|nr:hypothetical protein F4803DRAFT_555675 [Xylaria telfairii]